MKTIADKLSYLAGTKEAIKLSIIEKGVDIPLGTPFRNYSNKILDIKSGGGGSTPDNKELHAEITKDWPNIASIVENYEDNDYPNKCIWLLRNDSPVFDYTFGTNVRKVLLSDGTTYTASFKEHSWGQNTDPNITDYRWMIIYISGKNFQTDGRPIGITYNSAFLSGLTSFSSMFSRCSSLQTIPELDTSNGTNFSYMFYSCYSLQTIPELNTGNGTNFSQMFYNCYSLQTIPVLDTSNGTNFSYMFQICYSLQTIPELDTSNGTSFNNMFQNCYSLQTIPELNTSSGTDFSYMFSGCYSLQTIPVLDTSSGTNFSGMFSSCSSLQTIPLLDTSSGTSFNNMFYNCYSLQTIPVLDTSNGTNFSYMFSGCSSLQTIPVLDTSNGTNFSNMFQNCSSLQTIPVLDTSNGPNFRYMFSSCSSLQYVDVGDDPKSHQYNFSVSFNYSQYLAKESVIGIFNHLPTKEGQTITLHADVGNKLSEEEKEIATNKGWIVSY